MPQLARTLAQVSLLPVLETDLIEQTEVVQGTIDAQTKVPVDGIHHLTLFKALMHLQHQKSRLDFLKESLLFEESQHTQTVTLLESTIQSAKNGVPKVSNFRSLIRYSHKLSELNPLRHRLLRASLLI